MRDEYPTRSILLRTKTQVDLAIATMMRVPLDADKPLQFVLQEEQKPRTLSQNALMWVSSLKDIAEQVYVQGRVFDEKTWHEYFKEKYLPDDDDPDLKKLAKKKYQKWVILPNGNRRLIGSTTDLLIKGFSNYLEQVHAWGGNHGVEFSQKSMDQLYDARNKAA